MSAILFLGFGGVEDATSSIQLFPPRNYRLERIGNSANFFSYVCNSKKIKEWFASTLNGIAASLRCVFYMIVILNVKLPDQLRRTRTKKTVRNDKARQKCLFCQLEHKRSTSITVLTVHTETSLIYFPTIYAS